MKQTIINNNKNLNSKRLWKMDQSKIISDLILLVGLEDRKMSLSGLILLSEMIKAI